MDLQPEEYLSELATIRLGELITRDGGVVPDRLKSEALCEISFEAAAISKEMFKARDRAKPTAKARVKILHSLLEITKWASTIYASYGHELMPIAELEDYAEDLDDDLKHYGILACFYIQSAIKELSDAMFCEQEEPNEDELGQPVAEILALTCAISNRLECSFEDLLTESFQ